MVRRATPDATAGLGVEAHGAEGATVARRAVPVAPTRDAVGQAVHAPLLATPRNVVRLRIAGLDGEVVPTRHLPETTLLSIAAGQAAATHEDLDGASIGGAAIERRQA